MRATGKRATGTGSLAHPINFNMGQGTCPRGSFPRGSSVVQII